MIDRAVHHLSHFLAMIAAVALAAMVIHVTADVLGKYVLNQPIPGTAEVVASYYMVSAVFLPLAWIEIKNGSIVVELFYNLFGQRARRLVLFVGTALSALFYGVLAWLSWEPAVKAWRIGEVVESTWRVVIWPTKFLLPLGMGLACITLILLMIQMLTGRYMPPVDPVVNRRLGARDGSP